MRINRDQTQNKNRVCIEYNSSTMEEQHVQKTENNNKIKWTCFDCKLNETCSIDLSVLEQDKYD